MKPAPLEYLAASTAEEAVAALARFDGNARLLAGGQSLVPLSKPAMCLIYVAPAKMRCLTPGHRLLRHPAC